MEMNSHDQMPAGRIYRMIKLCVTESPLGSKHLMPGSYTSGKNPPETGQSALLPFPGTGLDANRPIHTEVNSLKPALWDITAAHRLCWGIRELCCHQQPFLL